MRELGKRPLFIYEMANNHMGDVQHGIRIVRELKSASEGFPFDFCVKLQYRHIDSCIHPEYQGRFDLKYVKRFSETRLSWDQYRQIKDAIVEAGFLSMCTPWDEVSVDKISEHEFDFMKVPSCYMTDWPLLEWIAKYDLPIVMSTAGEPLEEIDRVVSFFRHRNKQLTVMHCVGEYPAPDAHLHLGQISLLRKRYPEIPIGYSTHERPENFEAVKIAMALGAVMFEKHVGVPTDKYPLNGYSANPDQVRKWLQSAVEAQIMIGDPELRYPAPAGEQLALADLARGAFVHEPVAAGELIRPSNIFYAMPNVKGQLVAQDFSKYSEFMPYTKESRLLPQDAQLCYMVLKPPLVGSLDYTIRVHEESLKDPDGHPVYHSSWAVANTDGPPPRPGVTRVTVNEGSWLLEPIGNQTRATYTLYTDGGGIPPLLMNFANKQSVSRLFDALRDRIQKGKQ